MIHPIPSGTRDVLPDELRELRSITDAMRDVFDARVYGEVATPALEYETVLTLGHSAAADPAYRPAQIVMLSLLIEKAVERAGLEEPLAKTEPALSELLAATNPELIEAVLDRALSEAKNGGRNQVRVAGRRELTQQQKPR